MSDTTATPSAARAGTRASVAVATALCIAAMTAIGSRVFFGIGLGLSLTLAPVAGIAAGLATSVLVDAVLAAGGGVVLGTLLAQAAYTHPWPVSTGWPLAMAECAAGAAVVAGAVWWLSARLARLRTLLAAMAVVLLVLAGTMNGLAAAAVPRSAAVITGRPGAVMSFSESLTARPTQGATTGDEALYLTLVQGVATGGPYYATFLRTITAFDRAHAASIQDRTDTPLSYRLPTLYVALARLPQNGISFVLAALAMQAVAIVAAYALSRRFVSVPAALLGATAVMTYASALAATSALLFTEFWAGLLGLVAVALFVRSRATRSLVAMQIVSAVFALAAASVRELAAAFVLAGLLATILDPELRRRRTWVVWAVALVATAVGYAAHWSAASAVFHGAGVAATGAAPLALSWFHPDGLGLAAAVGDLARTLSFTPAATWVALALCVAGAVLVPAERGTRVFVGLVGLVGVLVLAVLRPSGMTTTGAALGYWGMVVMPTALACLPLAFSRLPGVRRPSSEPARDAPPPSPAENPAPA